MTRVFVSYSRRDEESARRMSNALRSAGVDVWMDYEKVQLGESWDKSIRKGVEESNYMIVLLTPDSTQSEWIANEVSLAKHFGRPIVPVLMKGATTAAAPAGLRNLQMIDANDNVEVAIRKLAADFSKHGSSR